MSTSPKPSRLSRFGTAVRRSTSLLSVARATTPSNADRDSDSVSLGKQKIYTTAAALQHSESSAALVPSPIAESPLREAEATAEPIGPSPLARPMGAESDPGGSPAEPEPAPGLASPTGYIPPPFIDSSAGNPGAFTDDPDSIPQPTIIQDPFASRSELDVTLTRTPQSASPAAQAADFVEPSTSEEEDGEGGRFFAKAMVESMHDGESDDLDGQLQQPEQERFAGAAEQNAVLALALPIVERSISTGRENEEMYQPKPKFPEPEMLPESQFTLPAYQSDMSMGHGHDVWGGSAVASAAAIGAQIEQRAPPGPSFPSRIEVSNSNASYITRGMPQPQPTTSTVQILPVESRKDEHPPTMMTLPPFNSIVAAKPVHQMPSTSSFIQSRNMASVGYDTTDETRPLLWNGTAKSQSYVLPHHEDGSSPLSSWVPSTSNAILPNRLHDLGWLEYHLPDGSFYYVHPTRRITTDVNLRVDKTLTDVTNYLEDGGRVGLGQGGSSTTSTPGVEVWLRDSGNMKKGFVPVRCYVDHHGRTVTIDKAPQGKGKKKSPVEEEDQLDMEFRYWSFMEAHPAHTTLAIKAKNEAVDVLTWAWTDRLLPSHRRIPAPFGQEECQELITLMRSFNNDNHDDHGIQTRVVSRILLRVALWRQMYFRPDKALPKDLKSSQLHLATRRRPISRAFFDFIVSCVCLGIPYLFLERARSSTQRIDEEGGIRSAGSVLVIGAVTCLVAAIVLSASVTFLSLPGLDIIARIAGLVAVIFASVSMVSTLVSFFKFKSDLEQRTAGSFVAVEGLMNISTRAVVMSLPLVFLAYSIIGLIVGIVLYSFRGASLVNLLSTSSYSLVGRSFEDNSLWSAVGMVGAIGGVLTMAWLAVRR